jgi:CheY-like chemotaxis protein
MRIKREGIRRHLNAPAAGCTRAAILRAQCFILLGSIELPPNKGGRRPEDRGSMNDKRCRACLHDNPVDAGHCEACDTAVEAVVTQPQPLYGFDKRPSGGAIWLDDLTQSQAPTCPAPAAATVPETLPELAITLLEVEAGAPVSAQWSAAPAPSPVEAPVLSDHERRPWPASLPASAEVSSRSATPGTTRADRKAERRAAVRKSRLRGKPAAGDASTASAVLVFDPHDGERDRLCDLLHDFGFRVSAAGRADEAAALAESHTFIAAFVDLVPGTADGGAGLDLCQRVLTASRRRGGTDTLLILTAARLQPMDRVRAELAGWDEAILKPVTRGSVAGVLDSRGIALPTDRRQS